MREKIGPSKIIPQDPAGSSTTALSKFLEQVPISSAYCSTRSVIVPHQFLMNGSLPASLHIIHEAFSKPNPSWPLKKIQIKIPKDGARYQTCFFSVSLWRNLRKFAIIYWERNVKQNGCDLSNHEGFHFQWEKCVPEILPMR